MLSQMAEKRAATERARRVRETEIGLGMVRVTLPTPVPPQLDSPPPGHYDYSGEECPGDCRCSEYHGQEPPAHRQLALNCSSPNGGKVMMARRRVTASARVITLRRRAAALWSSPPRRGVHAGNTWLCFGMQPLHPLSWGAQGSAQAARSVEWLLCRRPLAVQRCCSSGAVDALPL